MYVDPDFWDALYNPTVYSLLICCQFPHPDPAFIQSNRIFPVNRVTVISNMELLH